MPKAIRMYRQGGPEVLVWEDHDPGRPAPGEVRLRHTTVGVNFVDVYHRSGQFHGEGPPLPAIPGVQASGVVAELGAGVTSLALGDRVSYANIGVGSYCEERCVPADRCVRIPAAISDELASAALLRGMTSHYLLHRLYTVRPGDTILVHAAAGGVGLFMCQWAKQLGATVIGTVSTDAKAEIARAHGCDHPIVYTRESFVDRVNAITGGRGVPVVYDSVGRDTFLDSLKCLRPMGIAINFGTASGQVEPFPLQILHSKSLSVSRPTLRTWIASREDLVMTADAVFDVMASGKVKVDITGRYPLAKAGDAQAALESRKTVGALVLTV
jgi:NADPH2:quinone reductase